MDRQDRAGGSLALARLVDKHGGALLADLKSEYGIGPQELFSAHPLFLLNYIRELPESSRYTADLSGGAEFRGWTYDRYLAAAQLNSIRMLSYAYLSAHVKKKLTPPEPVWVPGEKSAPARKAGSFAALAKSQMAEAKRRKAAKWQSENTP